MTLGEYIERLGLSQERFAQSIKVRQSAVQRYVDGQRVPRPSVMRRIYAATHGLVQPNDFYDLPGRRGSGGGMAA